MVIVLFSMNTLYRSYSSIHSLLPTFFILNISSLHLQSSAISLINLRSNYLLLHKYAWKVNRNAPIFSSFQKGWQLNILNESSALFSTQGNTCKLYNLISTEKISELLVYLRSWVQNLDPVHSHLSSTVFYENLRERWRIKEGIAPTWPRTQEFGSVVKGP